MAHQTGDLPRHLERPHDSRLVTRAEAAEMLGYSTTSLATVMGRHPDRWPAPAAWLRKGRSWVLLWDADKLLKAAPPATASERRGRVATISDQDGLLTCKECGRRFRALGTHLNAVHGLTGAEYRQRHLLPATGALSSDGMRQAASDRQRASLADDPSAFDHLQPYQGPAHLDQMRETAIEVHRDTMTRDLVRAHRLPGQRYGVQVMLAQRRERLEGLAVKAGFASFEDAVRRTSDLTVTAAARRLGAAKSTIRRWRSDLDVGPAFAASGDGKIAMAGSKEVSGAELRRNLAETINDVAVHGEITYVTRYGHRIAAIVPVLLAEQIEQQSR